MLSASGQYRMWRTYSDPSKRSQAPSSPRLGSLCLEPRLVGRPNRSMTCWRLAANEKPSIELVEFSRLQKDASYAFVSIASDFQTMLQELKSNLWLVQIIGVGLFHRPKSERQITDHFSGWSTQICGQGLDRHLITSSVGADLLPPARSAIALSKASLSRFAAASRSAASCSIRDRRFRPPYVGLVPRWMPRGLATAGASSLSLCCCLAVSFAPRAFSLALTVAANDGCLSMSRGSVTP